MINKLLFLALFFITNISTFAQTPLIEAAGDISQLNPQQFQRYEEIKQTISEYDLIVSETIVSINAISAANTNGEFDLYLNIPCSNTHYLINDIEYENDNNYMLFANAISSTGDINGSNENCIGTEMFISCHDGITRAEIILEEQVFSIFHIDESVGLMLELDPTQELKCSPVNTTNVGESFEPELIEETGCIIDILIAYTDKVEQWVQTSYGYPSVIPLVKDYMKHLNHASEKSSSNGSYPVFQVCSYYKLDREGSFYSAPSDFFDYFKQQLFLADKKYDLAHAFLKERPTDDINVAVVGRGATGYNRDGQPAPKHYAVGYSWVHSSSPDNTFAHEIGHNLGADHEDRSSSYDNRGKHLNFKKWFLGKEYKVQTLLSNRENARRIPRYSNLNSTWFGEAIGDQDRNNFHFMNQNKCTVSAYSDRLTGSDYLAIQANNIMCEGDPIALIATGSDVNAGNLTFTWYKSTDGINWSFFANGTSCTYTHSPSDGSSIHFRLTRENQIGGRIHRYHSIIIDRWGNTPCAKQSKVNNVETKSPQVTAYPNPSQKGLIKLDFNFKVQGSLHIRAIDQTGKVVYTTEKSFVENDKVQLDLSSLPKGQYLIHVTNKSFEQYLKWSYGVSQL